MCDSLKVVCTIGNAFSRVLVNSVVCFVKWCNVIVDITISSCLLVFRQSDVQISAGLTNISSLAVTAFDLVNCPLESVLWFVFVLDVCQ